VARLVQKSEVTPLTRGLDVKYGGSIRTPEIMPENRKQDSYINLLSDSQNFDERYIMKQDEDSDIRKLGLSDNSLISYSVNQSFQQPHLVGYQDARKPSPQPRFENTVYQGRLSAMLVEVREL